MKHAASLLLTAGVAAAQSSTVVRILMPMADPQAIAASVISAGPTATDYLLTCVTGTPDDACGLADGLEVLYGPSTLTYAMSYAVEGETYSNAASCSLDPAEEVAVCTATMVSGSSTDHATDSITSYSSHILPITVTAGLDKLSAVAGDAPTATAGPAATTTPATTAAPTSAGQPGSGSEPGEGEDDDGEDPAADASTAGVPRVTQNAVVLGAAALVGGVMLW